MNRKINFVNNNVYHIYNRGVHRTKTYLDDADYKRWERLLSWQLEYNFPLSIYLRRVSEIRRQGGDVEHYKEVFKKTYRVKKPLVDVIAYVEMPNHYHLILRQLEDDGVSKYMHKLSTAYTMYFNRLHKMSGALFQSRFGATWVKDDEQFLQVCRYVHINPVKLGVSKTKLVDYKNSSYPAYALGEDNPIIKSSFLKNMFPNAKRFVDFTLAEVDEDGIDNMKNLTLDDDFNWYEREREFREGIKQEAIDRLAFGL